MNNRFLIVLCVLCSTVLLIPQMARTYEDDASLKEKVKPAIEAGVEYLKSVQLGSGVWVYQGNQGSLSDPHTIGATALAAIALMECGVSPKDRQIQAASSIIHQAVANPGLTATYTLSLCVLFLDRVNRDSGLKHKDAGLINALAGRIATGQFSTGGWHYNIPSTGSDNSNTQFAVVALWVARKYNKPGSILDQALARAEQKFRKSQHQDGGWGYDTTAGQAIAKPTGSMTCAGILGIALHAGARGQTQTSFKGQGGTSGSGDVAQSLDADAQVSKAKTFLLRALQSTVQFGNDGVSMHTPPYFLWSLERVATLYKWRKLDGVDWFELGAKYLLAQQQRRGNWYFGREDPGVETAFCLLFLAKSNLLGNLYETALGGGAIGDVPKLSEKSQKDPKTVSSKEQAKALTEKLLASLPPQQTEILNALIEGKGSDYTDALVDVISKLNTNASKEAAREALANRFQRLKVDTLSKYMDPELDREFRLAAAVAVRLKNDTSAAASLIPLLADQDIGVSTAALDSLKAISGQDFGKSVERWSRWLDTVPKKP
ncbi:MAG TPA: hypothetical protein PLN21_06340 [Gemmatales bacterium]|nr:hypothetical protein [Gemmatales bacterium]